MIFNDPAFLLLFLPLAILLVFVPGMARIRLVSVIVLSLAFYETSGGLRQALVLVGCVVWVYLFTASASVVGSRTRLICAISVPLGALAFFKYADFLLSMVPIQTAADISPKGALPAGISFYVFHLVSFAIDRYRGDWTSTPKPSRFLCYVAFFPQLVAGPITRYRQVAEAIENLPRFILSRERLNVGVRMFVIGLGCKVLFADPLGRAVAPLISDIGSLNAVKFLFLVFGYSFQIYFDFYGYSMMALGLGEVFGISLPANFNRPYLSADPKEFWRRWHMTLSLWIRDYLYLPLGGNKRYARNIAIVFALCGLWHGAGWNFVVWGLYHGALILGYHGVRSVWQPLAHPLRVAVTFVLVSVGWLLFVFDLPTFLAVLPKALVAPSWGQVMAVEQWLLLIGAAALAFLVDTDKLARATFSRPMAGAALGVGLAMVTIGCFGLIDRSEVFIYFRF